jgi:glycosyltransferase involved in cell wall biosynthesis
MLSDRVLREELENIDENVKLYLLKYPKYPYSPSILPIVFEIIKQIKIFNPDVIHFQGTNPILCLVFPFLKKYPLVGTFHDVKPHVGEGSLLGRFGSYCARKYSNQIIVHGEKLKEQMIKEYNLPDEKVHAIPIGEHRVIPFKKYEREDLKEDQNLILFFGRIKKYKGLRYLIKAEPMISKEIPNTKIVIAGVGEDFKKYEEIMLNKDNFVIYNHYISYKEGAELFQRCSIVVLPYIGASQSGVISTAYGFKKAVVVTNVGAIPEIVDDGVTGLIVPPRNPEALADAIVKLLMQINNPLQMNDWSIKKFLKVVLAVQLAVWGVIG